MFSTPFSFGSVTVPFLSIGRETSLSLRTFTGLPSVWSEKEYWVFLEHFLRGTTLSYLPLWTADFSSNAACSPQIIFSQIFLAIQYISISKDLIGKHENKWLWFFCLKQSPETLLPLQQFYTSILVKRFKHLTFYTLANNILFLYNKI